MERYSKIDKLMVEGHKLIEANNSTAGCDKWLEAWEEIKALLSEGIARDVFDLDNLNSQSD